MPRPLPLPTLLVVILFTLTLLTRVGSARADDPPPAQTLPSAPGLPFPRIELSADGAAIAFSDYALRVDLALEPWIAAWFAVGMSRRHGGETILVEVGGTLWPLGWGLEGLWIAPAVGVAIAGPWNGDSMEARTVLRYGGDVGWQFLWGDIAIALGGGATGFAALDGSGEIWVEPRVRAAVGIVWR